MMAASLAPDRIRRLILVAPVNPWSLFGKPTAEFLTKPWVTPIFLKHGSVLERSDSWVPPSAFVW